MAPEGGTVCDDCGLPATEAPRCGPCLQLFDESNGAVSVRPLSRDDLELVYAWRSNPLVYEHFREQDSPLDWDSHVSWFNSRDASRFDFVIHYDGRRVGVVSLDSADKSGIYLGDISSRGDGVATRALNWLCSRFAGERPLYATIEESNDASRRLFERCGFVCDGVEDGWEHYEYRVKD
ncbi:GNAT family N-acetyltransferase [Haloarchaeobius sp. DT45]|uniref:GNAT family N-acetyltransferase n=1 Tax=Haloarchaeobius sp. DT45 TaxID=3446116 RepID=UPI003F6D63E9